MLEALIAQFPKEYINDYGLSLNPIAVVIPCFEGKNFFGPCVLNLVSITNACDGTDMQAQIDFFKTVFSRFILYETHIWIKTDGFPGDPAATEGFLVDMCGQLTDYGFTYHGRLNEQAQSQLILDLHTAFKERVRDRLK